MIQDILVLGAGSAGLIAAVSLKRKIPQLNVRVVRSPELGVIGVGEGTTPNFPGHLFDYLGISRKQFYAMAEPTWKLGIRFLWGPRDHFNYTFSPELDSHWTDLPLPNGFFCQDEFVGTGIASALMEKNKAFPRQKDGAPDIQPWHAFHIENQKFVSVLELIARRLGVEIIDGKVSSAERGPTGISAVFLDDGRKLHADFFIDASGFRSELLGRTMEEPFVSYDRSLFCDRAVVGGWDRGDDEPILPYTTAETMEAGWSWQIEHEHHVNRGYVYSSQAISDDEAAAEFLKKNPKAPKDPRIVKFRSGRRRRFWVDNVLGIGNAVGFVEPLEATAIMIVCSQTRILIDFLLHTMLQPTQTIRDLYNERVSIMWDDTRDFLALHYRLNTRIDNPFWRHCINDTDVSGIEPLLEFYRENGPTGFCRHRLPTTESDFGVEGYLVMLVGNRYPFQARFKPTADELQKWEAHRSRWAAQAAAGFDVKGTLAVIRHPGWQWNGDVPQGAQAQPPAASLETALAQSKR